MELSLHAIDKLQTYGIEGETFLDVSSGASGLLIVWEGRPWVVILSNNGLKVVTTYPTDERTVANRRGGGRWIFPNN